MNLSDDAKAELLVAPKYTAKIFNRGLCTFNKDAVDICRINKNHGIHYKGRILAGMKIYSPADAKNNVNYEEVWANKVRHAWEQANSSGKAVTTGLAIGTRQIVHGRKAGKKTML